MPKAKRIVKNEAVNKAVNSAMNTLSSAGVECSKSLAVATKQAKSYLAEAKRLGKKRATLLKRKKSAAARLKKTANAVNRKAHKAVEKELAAVKKAIAKLAPVKSAHAIELASLKASLKRITTYTGVLDKADKLLNKPKKKKRKKRAKKAVAAA